MKISDEHLDEFISLYIEKYGVVLGRSEAYEKALKLLRLVELVESNKVDAST